MGKSEAFSPFVRILHIDAPATPDNPFALESGHVRPMQGLSEIDANVEFHKGRHSALVGTGLSVWLDERGIGRLITRMARRRLAALFGADARDDLHWRTSSLKWQHLMVSVSLCLV